MMRQSSGANAPGILTCGLALALLLGCLDGGGGDPSLQGAAVLRGVVAEFEAAGQVFTGGVEGVSVTVVGTDLEATTAEDGLFVIAGVPPGEVALQFSLLDTSARLRLSVPAEAEVTLNQVRVRQGQVRVDRVDVTSGPTPSGDSGPGPPATPPMPSTGPGPMGSEGPSGAGASR